MPRRRALTLYQGDAETLRLTVEDEETGEPTDLTGVTVQMLCKPSKETPDDDDSVIVLSTATGEIVVDSPITGVCQITAGPTVTADAGVQWHKIQALPGPRTILYGPLTIEDT